MARFFEFLLLIVLIVILIGAFWIYVYVVALGNPWPFGGNRVFGDSTNNVESYNFQEPISVPKSTDLILSENLKNQINNAENVDDEFTLNIPSIDVSTTVTADNSIDTLNQDGWLVLPFTYKYQHSYFARLFDRNKRDRNEAIVLCHRNFYEPRDIKSCYYMDRIEVDDTINFDGGTFKVLTVTTIPVQPEYVFEASSNENYLKIVTNSGPNREPDLNTHYLIVIAEKGVGSTN